MAKPCAGLGAVVGNNAAGVLMRGQIFGVLPYLLRRLAWTLRPCLPRSVAFAPWQTSLAS